MQKQTLSWRSHRHQAITHAESLVGARRRRGIFLLLTGMLLIAPTLALADDDEIDIDRARWSNDRDRLTVRGDNAPDNATVTIWYGEKEDDGAKIGETTADNEGEWTFRVTGIDPVPCDVTAKAGDDDDDKEVRRAPRDCSNDGGDQPPAPNTPPVANPDSYNTDEDSVLDIAAPGVLGNDTDADGDALTVAASTATSAQGANVSVNANGSFSYNPTGSAALQVLNNGQNVNDTFSYTISDGNGGSDSATVTVTVAGVDEPVNNIAPVANSDSYNTPQDTLLNVGAPGVLGNDADGDGDTLTAQLRTQPRDGSVSLNANGSFTYTPDNGFSGSDSFTYRANDGQDASNDATVTITVTPVVASQCPDPLPTTLPDAHELCATPYTGPEVCLQCHEGEARDMHSSVHYQQNGPTDFVTNIGGLGGERGFDFAATGINTYCGSHENSPRFTCAGCHVGNGRYPVSQTEFENMNNQEQLDQLANIDCLTCHQEQYRRFPDWTDANGNLDLGLFEDLTLENVTLDADGGLLASPGDAVVRTGLEGIPVVDDHDNDGRFDFLFAPAGGPGSIDFELPTDSPFAPMSITTEVAAQTVHRTTRRSCLSCHAGAAGADGAKRGDLTSLHANPDIGLDQHMSPAGQDMTCSDCHTEVGNNGESHRVRGRGLDLRPNDVSGQFTCTDGCHNSTPHGNTRLDRHTAKVACQTCHIPAYGKGIATETSRDWQDPHLSQSACNGRGGWLPREDKGSDLIPSYTWFDGKSEVYFMGEPLDDVPTVPLASDVAQRFGSGFNTGDPAVVLGTPTAILAANGSIDMTLGANNPNAKLQAMKEHWGKLARNDTSNPDILISHSTYDFFRTGDFDEAVRSGLEQDPDMDVSDQYTVVPVHTFQTLNHGVEPKNNALDCGDCHTSSRTNLSGGPVRLDLKGELGYALRTDRNLTTCSNSGCHGSESASFTGLHDEHRNRFDCSGCHADLNR